MQEKKEVTNLPNLFMNNWITYYKKIGLSENLIDQYSTYIDTLRKNNLPIIFEINHLALLLGVNKEYLKRIIFSTDNFYRNFSIPKKSGGVREILAPYPTLLLIQKWILKNILSNIKINTAAHAFINKKSIITNCKFHVNQDEILKIDLENFFPSINFERIIVIFNKLGYSKEISFYLARLCCLDGKLPQGAPTSPYLSNIVCKKLDKRLYLLSKKFNIKYSRYADDLAFSCSKVPTKFIDYISEILEDEGFTINKCKTRLYKKNNKKILTGIVISDSIKLPREYKRNLKQDLHNIQKYGYSSHIGKNKIKDVNYLLRILGKVNFWLSVEPENIKALSYKKMLLEEHKRIINFP